MATEVSSIDDLLAGVSQPSATTVPAPVEEPVSYDMADEIDSPSYDEPPQQGDILDQKPQNQTQDDAQDEPAEDAQDTQEIDDYGNPKAAPRTYTEEEVNERINKAVRDRLARERGNQTPAEQAATQAKAAEFEYDPDSKESWQSQLEQFVEKTVSKMGQKEAQRKQQERDMQAQQEFQERFTNGMDRFGDFKEVVGAQPISDPMTYALRGMKDPAAFIYAASKRAPQEIQRISRLEDPYAQMVEMGKLEERMRKQPMTTKAPRPVTRTTEDLSSAPQKKKTEPSIEDLIAHADAKRRAQLTSRRGRG